jgi:hypothetical protein
VLVDGVDTTLCPAAGDTSVRDERGMPRLLGPRCDLGADELIPVTATLGLSQIAAMSPDGVEEVATINVHAAATGAPAPTGTIQIFHNAQSLEQCEGAEVVAGSVACGTGTIHAGRHSFAATFTSGAGFASATTPTVTQQLDAPSFTSAPSATATTGHHIDVHIAVRSAVGAAITEQGKLPAGVTFHHTRDAATLTGIPAAQAAGRYRLTLTATDALGTRQQTFTLTVNAAPRFTTARHVRLRLHHRARFVIAASGAPTPSLTRTGGLPPGLTTHKQAGRITLQGTPRGPAKTYTIRVTAHNAAGTSSQSLTITTKP